MSQTLELTCAQCGKQFVRKVNVTNHARAKTGPFCSKACHNRFRCLGKPLSKKHRAKLMGRPAWNKGKYHSEETKRKISEKAKLRIGSKNPHWKGGRYIRGDGYVHIRVGRSYRMEHVVMMEKHLGRPISRREVVHHIDDNRQNNVIENLEVMSIAEHMRLHHPNGIVQRMREKVCVICGATFSGRHNAILCSEPCKRQRQRERERKYDAKRRDRTAKIAENS